MRGLAFALLRALLASGCVSQSGVVEPAPEAPSADTTPSSADGAAPPPEEAPTFCEAERDCDFWDEDYHEYVLYDVDSVTLDVLIVPSASHDALQDTATMEAAVLAWGAGIQELGAAWFADAFTLNVYVLGEDVPPAAAVQDPEIVVLAAEYNPALLLGIGLEPKQLGCALLGEETLRAYPVHAHGGMQVSAADCTGVGFLCVAANTNFLLGRKNQLHDLVAHEFGHCLGAGHVGDALDFSAKRVPVQDIMSYQNDPDQVHCVSTLNVRVLESLYAPLLGVTPDPPLSAGDYHAMPVSEYDHVACANP